MAQTAKATVGLVDSMSLCCDHMSLFAQEELFDLMKKREMMKIELGDPERERSPNPEPWEGHLNRSPVQHQEGSR